MGMAQKRAGKKPRKRKVSNDIISRHGLQIYQKGDQIKALTGNCWDVASQSKKDKCYRLRGIVPHASIPKEDGDSADT